MTIDQCAQMMKDSIETAITTAMFDGKKYENGEKAKEALIRSQKLINFLHEGVKTSLVKNGLNQKLIFPPVGSSKPELKLAGFLKQKDQDVCVIPNNISPKSRLIDWGPLTTEHIEDPYGEKYTKQTLVINVRSQLSSLAKNTDTLFERTFAEALNLHIMYPEMVMGEVYMIPVYEYDDTSMKNNQVSFKRGHTNIEKYISFFRAVSHRSSPQDDDYKYEHSALIIVDFSKPQPKVYRTTAELIQDGLVGRTFPLELADISFDPLCSKLIRTYSDRFDINNLI